MTVFRYSQGFYIFPLLARILQFSALTQILPFSDTRWDGFSIPGRILPFPGTRPDSTTFRYSHRFDLFPVLALTVFRYSHRFCLFPEFFHYSVLTQIRPVSGTSQDNFSILARILHFPAARPDSTTFRHSHRFYPFMILAGTIFRYLDGFYLFPVLALILPLFGTHTDSTYF